MKFFRLGLGGELALERDRERRWIAAVVGALAFLATLALGLALALAGTAQRWQASFEGTLTAEIPAGGDAATALRVLRADPAVAHAEAFARARAEKLLAPWLGAGNLADLPIPVLIDVKLREGAHVDLPGLRRKLAAAVPGADLDDHSSWLSGFLALARAATIVASIVVAAVALAAASCVAFATRAGLAMHREAVDLLHLVGAEDAYIASQFAQAAMRLAFAGAAAGTLGGAAVLAVAHSVASSAQSLAFPLPALGAFDWAALAAVPVAATLVAAVAAYATVLRNLGRIL
ncbi:MAG: FtsX-like permease family protein [Alphaproteobacteria bacterium]|nr:FtsX-like permease family protein [Alphaproteobacteria bacterium]